GGRRGHRYSLAASTALLAVEHGVAVVIRRITTATPCSAAGPPGQRAARRAGSRSRRRRSCALSATTTVETDMRIAPAAIGMTNPTGASTPAASGTAAML